MKNRLSSSTRWPAAAVVAAALVIGLATSAGAQVTPAAGCTPPDDTPSVMLPSSDVPGR